jgi:peroxiredoxin
MLDGRVIESSRLLGPRGAVLVFLGTQCPVSNQYVPKLNELCAAAEAQGVRLFGINSNASETVGQVRAQAQEHGLRFPMLKDPGGAAAERWKVTRTNEALLVDARGVLRYRGAIDDELRPGVRKGSEVHPFLEEAIRAVVAGRAVATPTTEVFGCPIEWPQPAAAGTRPRIRPAHAAILAARRERDEAVAVGPVTYHRDVAAILADRCQPCHRPRQVAPFSLRDYPEARRWAAAIAEAVEDYRMPPWHADPRYGRFANDRSLTARQRATLLAWVEQGCPEGDPVDEPSPRPFPDSWSIGTPDAIYEMPEPFEVPAHGTVPIQRFRIASGLSEDRWIQAAEMQAGDRSFVFIEPHRDNPGALARTGPVLVAYVPGDAPSIYPPGIAKRIPAGSDLLFEVHYTPTGRRRVDRSRVGLIYAREPVHHEAVFRGVSDRSLVIPPGAADYPSRASYTFPRPVHLLSLFPHMHMRGKDFRIIAAFPDGRRETLLSVPAYDYAWQSVYRLAEPMALPAGTRIECLAHFDNSAANLVNPDPTATVRWGDNTTDEMMIGYLEYYEDSPRLKSQPPIAE